MAVGVQVWTRIAGCALAACPAGGAAGAGACGGAKARSWKGGAAAAAGAEAGPLLVVHVDGEALAPPSACGGFGRLCLPETSLQAGLTLELRHPPAHAYRKCRVEVGDGPNTARQAQRSRGRRHDYDIFASDPSRQGYHLNSGEDKTLSVSGWWLHVEHDGEEEGPESLTLRGKCGGSPNNRAHRDLRWAPTTVWIADVPWPKLTVERPSGGRVSGAGVDCGSGGGVDCEESYATGSAVELSAAADAHHRFAGWGGACSGSAASCTVELDADRRVSASFEATSHLLTVERPEHGRVTGSGIDCGSGSGSDCTERLAAGATARLSAAADANHRLLGWTGACAGTAGASCAVAMDGAKTAGAEFGAEQRWLWVSPPRRGRIAGPGIDCGSGSSDCTEQYDHGAEVELTATADANHELASWSGACEGAEASCALRMESNLAAGADFALVRRTLTVERPANGHVAAKGVDCGSGTRAACSTSKAHGSVVVARATADEGYEFESWTGACGAARWPKCQLKLDGDLTVGATFKRAKRTLTVAPPANGHVAGPGIGCGAGSRTDCTEQYDHGTEAELTAVPDPNRRLSAWSGACSGSATTTCTVAMDADKTVGAAFVWVKRTLTVERPAHGHVTGAGISCGAGDRADCTEQYDHGTEVKLTAVPDPNRRLSAWSGACSGSATTTCTVAMDADKAVGAAFVWEKRTLTVARPAHGHVAGAGISCGAGDRTDCTEQYDHGTEVKLTAVPDLNRRLSAWGGACSGSATTTCTVAMDADKAVGAAFVWVKRTLTVARPAYGHVTGAGISCGAGDRTDCTEQYDHGTEVELTAVPDLNRRLSAWSGACSGSAAACVVAMDADKTVGAAFVWEKRTLTVERPVHGHVAGAGISCGSGDRTDCTEQYDHGTTVTLEAVPDLNRKLSAWSGACSASASTTCAVLLDGDKTVGAAFVWEKRTLTVTRPSHGHVTGAGINCGSSDEGTDCTEQYDHGTTVELTAEPDTNRKLSAWSGACSASASTTCAVLLDGDKTVGAAFVWEKRTLTVTRPSHGYVAASGISCGSGGRTDCAEQYDHGTKVKLTAEPDANRKLSAWSGACSASATTTCAVLLDGDKTVGAAFVWVKRKLTVTRPGNGYVAASGISCGSGGRTDCTEQYDHGTEITLKAVPDVNRKLSAWSGACSASASTTCRLLLGADETVGATFVWEKRKLTVSRSNLGYVTGTGISCGSGLRTDCAENYDHGTKTTLTALGSPGYQLYTWGGACEGASSVYCEVLMDAAKTVSATYVAMCGATTLSGCRLPETSWNGTAGSCVHGGSCSYRCTKGQWHRASNTCCSPVDGGWSDWGDCSQNTCGASGTKTRSCTSPSPSCGGAACSGRRTMHCTGNSPVNGGWSDWSECSTACGETCTKTRSCTEPSPACGGAVCSGSSTMPYVGNSPENGACDESVRNGCSAGTANDAAVDDTTTHYKWRCDGKCNGSNSGTCKKQKPGCKTASWQVTTAIKTYRCSADIDLPSGGDLAVSDDDPDDVGKAKFSCDAGVLTEDASMSKCYEYPRCSKTPPKSSDDACDWKDDGTSRFPYARSTASTYEDGACGTADGACAKGNPTAVTTSRVDGKCGDAVDQCANNTVYEDLDDTAAQRRWRCKGIDGRKSWNCNGTTGIWRWSCTHNDHTNPNCIKRDHTGSDDDDCTGSADPAASATLREGALLRRAPGTQAREQDLVVRVRGQRQRGRRRRLPVRRRVRGRRQCLQGRLPVDLPPRHPRHVRRRRRRQRQDRVPLRQQFLPAGLPAVRQLQHDHGHVLQRRHRRLRAAHPQLQMHDYGAFVQRRRAGNLPLRTSGPQLVQLQAPDPRLHGEGDGNRLPAVFRRHRSADRARRAWPGQPGPRLRRPRRGGVERAGGRLHPADVRVRRLAEQLRRGVRGRDPHHHRLRRGTQDGHLGGLAMGVPQRQRHGAAVLAAQGRRLMPGSARHRRGALAGLALASAAGVVEAAAPPALFSAPAETEAAAAAARIPDAPRLFPEDGLRPRFAEAPLRVARTDLRALAEARRAVEAGAPAELALDLFADVSLTAVLERAAATRRGYSLSGRVAGEAGSAVTLVANGEVFYGTVSTPGASYEIRTLVGGLQAIGRKEPRSWRCGSGAPPAPGRPVFGGRADGDGREAPALADAGGTARRQPAGAGPSAEDDGGDDGSVVDLAVFYLPSARVWAGGHRAALAMLDHHVAWINDAYARSEVDLRIELVAAVGLEAPPERLGTYVFRDRQHRDHPYLDEFHAVLDASAADVWAVGVGANGGGVCCTVWGIGDASTLAHELGHDMGLGHQRQDYGYRGRFPYSHGYEFQVDGYTYFTIMVGNLVGRGELPRFSNPRHRHLGHPLGVPGEEPTDAVDGPADAARSLNETRREVSRRRQSAERCGYRLSGPADIPAEGGAFAVRVEADAGCAWTARAVDGVATVESGASGVGSGVVGYRVPANAGWEREVALAVAGEMHVGVQPGTRPLKPVCERSAAVREALSAELGLPCGEVSAAELATVGRELHVGGVINPDSHQWIVEEAMPAPAPGDFDGLTNLAALHLVIGPGETLPAGVFDGLANLQRLGVHHARFGTGPGIRRISTNREPIALEAGTFDGLSGLYSLSLENVAGIRPGVFRGLPRVHLLFIEDSDLSGLQPGAFGELSSVARIILEDSTGLSLPPGVFAGLDELHIFQAASPRRRTSMGPLEPGVFDGLPRLWAIDFFNVGISELRPGAFHGVADSLTSLSLIAALSNLEAGVFDGLSRLETIELDWNELPVLPPGLFRGIPLERLYLRGVGLTELDPAWYEDLPNLGNLDLRDNRLSELPPDLLRALPNLHLLQLADNRLRALPERFFAHGNGLWKLSLHGNPGAPFVLKAGPRRAPGLDYGSWLPSVAMHMPQGAPRYLRFRLSASGGLWHGEGPQVVMYVGEGKTSSYTWGARLDGGGLFVATAELLTDLTPGPCGEDTFLHGFLGSCLTGLHVEVDGPLVLNGVPDGRLSTDDRWRIALENVFLEFPMAGTSYAASSSDPAVAEAAVEGGALVVTPRREGEAAVTITATAADGRTATRTFAAAVHAADGRPFLRGWRLSLLAEDGP